jgi:pyruvate,water dikinase
MANKFLDPHDVPQFRHGGWEKMYPYSTRSPKMTLRGRLMKAARYVYDGLHYPEPHYPFDLIWMRRGTLRCHSTIRVIG